MLAAEFGSKKEWPVSDLAPVPTLAGAAGQIPARIYTPDGAGPFTVIVYFH